MILVSGHMIYYYVVVCLQTCGMNEASAMLTEESCHVSRTPTSYYGYSYESCHVPLITSPHNALHSPTAVKIRLLCSGAVLRKRVVEESRISRDC